MSEVFCERIVATSNSTGVDSASTSLFVLINLLSRLAISAMRCFNCSNVASCFTFFPLAFEIRDQELHKNEMPLAVTTRQGAFPYLFCFTTTTKGVYMRERFRQLYTVPICVKPSER